jgi:hypothetical protein
MTFYGIDSILGAGGSKAAAWRQDGRKKDLVAFDQGKTEQRAEFLQIFFHQCAMLEVCRPAMRQDVYFSSAVD